MAFPVVRVEGKGDTGPETMREFSGSLLLQQTVFTVSHAGQAWILVGK